MNQQKLICLIGKSGSGKTAIVKVLEQRGYNILQSYTTRKPREDNEWGHLFCSIEEYRQLENDGQLAAYTHFDGNHYFATKQQVKESDIYVVDPQGVRDLQKQMPEIKIVSIYLKVSPEKRQQRMRKRGDTEDQITRRIINDIDKFERLKCDYKVSNNDFDKAVNIIDYIIQQEMKG